MGKRKILLQPKHGSFESNLRTHLASKDHRKATDREDNNCQLKFSLGDLLTRTICQIKMKTNEHQKKFASGYIVTEYPMVKVMIYKHLILKACYMNSMCLLILEKYCGIQNHILLKVPFVERSAIVTADGWLI